MIFTVCFTLFEILTDKFKKTATRGSDDDDDDDDIVMGSNANLRAKSTSKHFTHIKISTCNFIVSSIFIYYIIGLSHLRPGVHRLLAVKINLCTLCCEIFHF